MNEIKFVVPGIPVAKGRPRFTRRGNCFTPKKTESYENQVKYAFLNAYPNRPPIIDKPVSLTIEAIFPIPKSAKVNDRVKTTRPDLDNIIKIVGDALNGIVWRDDSIVWRVVAEKIECRGNPPELHIKIYY
jgi:Holliday junction resolvase RusA-like endonuclease